MIRLFIKLFIIIFTISAGCMKLQSAIVPRTIVAIYTKSEYVNDLSDTYIHKYAEMPLNFLGYKLEYHDIADGLPNISSRNDIRGVISWFEFPRVFSNPLEYIDWSTEVISSGKKFLIIGNPGFTEDLKGKTTPLIFTNKLWNKIGINDTGSWIGLTLGYQLKELNPLICSFERLFPIQLPSFRAFNKIDTNAITVLGAKKNASEEYDLITVSKNGSYATDSYLINLSDNIILKPDTLQWYINPFKYFSMVFQSQKNPKPDITTLAGRRIYFSHIDGDGWLNYTKIESYRSNPVYCPEIIMNKIIKKFPNLPVTVAPIIAEIFPKYAGNKISENLAREILSLPQVQVGSHTFTHPFEWKYFENETKIKEHYGKQSFWKIFTPKSENSGGESSLDNFEAYAKPRAYAFAPFKLSEELEGSLAALESLLPKGKKGHVIQWSGDCLPYAEALKHLHEHNICNINGGDSRFDNKYPSYGWIYPIGRQVGKYHQIYAQSSNENTYTDLWTKNFFAFKSLKQTLKNTNSPLRILPIDIYYHMYSGEHISSVDAIISNIKYALKQNIIPITTLDFCQIAEGFYSTEFVKKSDNSWIVKNRGNLQTIRFSEALFYTVDYKKSIGITGHKHFENSLYVYLDKSVYSPEIHLKPTEIYWCEQVAERNYLIDSTWEVWNLKLNNNSVTFSTKGFGNCNMKWSVPQNGYYEIFINGIKKAGVKAQDNILNFIIKLSLYNAPVVMRIRKVN